MEQRKLTLSAPVDANRGQMQPILDVEVEPDQAVEWVWTHYPDGRSAVTGYNLIAKGKGGKGH